MGRPDSDDLTIEPVSLEHQAAALRLLLAGGGSEAATADGESADLISADLLQRNVQRICRGAREGRISLAGLFEAAAAKHRLGVVWSQLQPGRSAILWTPQFESAAKPEEMELAATRLIERALAFAATQDVRLVQSVVAEPVSREAKLLEAAGLQHAAVLDYLFWQATDVNAAPIKSDHSLVVTSYEPACDRVRLEHVLAATFEGTQDCPLLSGVRQPGEMLDGYAAAGESGTRYWHFLVYEGVDVGCLLLADQPRDEEFELVYVGLAPAWRGRGLGREAVRHAQRLTRAAGRARLVLAVDTANEPAQRMYAGLGFIHWQRRSVMLKVLDK
ncbi:MAG: GNAT family N-acetyltransferase [Planctomycetia bacterium]|nr:GNAT family N-acetyltransferase [Planctomycetia bacterium]